MGIMDGPVDLEEMDVDERAELEAMLYAQIHYSAASIQGAAPGHPGDDSAQAGVAGPGGSVSEAVCSAVKAGADDADVMPGITVDMVGAQNSGSVAMGAESAISSNGGKSSCVGNSTKSSVYGGTVENDQQPQPVPGPSGISSSSLKSHESTKDTYISGSSLSSLKSSVLQTSHDHAPVNANSLLITQDSSSSKNAGPVNVDPVGDNGEPETKTAALAVSTKPSSKPRSGRMPLEVATIGSSVSDSSDGDGDDDLIVDATVIPAVPAGAKSMSEEATSNAKSQDSVIDDVTVVEEAMVGKSSPEVVELSSNPPTPLAPCDSRQPDESTTELPEHTPDQLNPKQDTHLPSTSEDPILKPSATQHQIILKRRARSLGATLTPVPKRPGQRPRTSSDLSSSGSESDDAGRGTLEGVPCDIQVNIQGPEGTLAAQQKKQQEDQREDDDEDAGEDDASTTEGQLVKLPQPICQDLLKGQLDHTSPFVRELSSIRPCHKWNRQQRQAYLSPRQYRLDDVDVFLQTLPDDGWEIPSYFQQSSHQAKLAKMRYYNSIQRGKCRRCEGEGHVQANCPLPPVCHLCGGVGHSGVMRCPNMFCYMCGAEDHPESRCPRHMRPCFCALCKAKGHTSDMCPDKWRRYHVTTTPGATTPVIPHPHLDFKPRKRSKCWQCGQAGHPGHQCDGDRYTGLSSLSQQLISYTDQVCPSSSVSGIVATPPQMDLVFTQKTRQKIEKDTGAMLTYEELGRGSWLINISGPLHSAQNAHSVVTQLIHGGGNQARPRARSASPLHSAETERRVSNESLSHGGREEGSGVNRGVDEVSVVEEDSEEKRREAWKLEKKRQRKERKKENKRKRKQASEGSVLGEGGRDAACATVNEPHPIDEVDNDVQVVEEVPASSSEPKAKKPKLRNSQFVELITVVSDDEGNADGNGSNHGNSGNQGNDSDPEIVETGPGSGLDDMMSAARVWRLNLVEGEAASTSVDSSQLVRNPTKKQIKIMRKGILEKLRNSPGVLESEDPAEVVSSASDTVICVSSSENGVSESDSAAKQTKGPAPKEMKKKKAEKKMGEACAGVGSLPVINGIGAHQDPSKLSRKERKNAKAARLATSSEAPSSSLAQPPSNRNRPPPGSRKPKPKKPKPAGMPPSFCYMTQKLEQLIASEGKNSPAAKKIRRLLNRQRKKAEKWRKEQEARAAARKHPADGSTCSTT